MIYLNVVFSILIAQVTTKKFPKIFYSIFLILLFLMSATRVNVGTDTIAFNDHFSWIIAGSNTYMEAGFEWLGRTIHHFGGDYQTFIFVCTIPVFLMVHIVITKNINKQYWIYALFLVVASGLMFTSYNIFRQFIAMSFSYFAIEFFLQEKYIYTVLCIVAALFFHTSILFFLVTFLPLVTLREKVYFKKMIMCIFFISLLFIFLDFRPIFISIVSLIPNRYNSYLHGRFMTEQSTMGFLKTFFPSAMFFLYMFITKKELFYDKRKAFYSIGFFLYVIFSNFFNGIVILIRLADYFYPFLIVGTIWTIESTKRWERLFLVSLVTIYFLLLMYFSYIAPNAMDILPYDSILFTWLNF